MANDEQGGTDLAKWSGFEISVPPPFMEPIIETVNSFLEQIIELLDIALFALDIAKVWIVGLVSPILAILDYLINLLEGILNDLRKAGLYLRGDWSAFENSNWIKSLKGGYAKYEGRVFQWLNDGTDPTRPDFSEKSAVVGMFFYVSVDFSSIERAIKALMSLLAFLGRFFDAAFKTLPTPTNVRFSYPTVESTGLKWGEQGAPPKEALIQWEYANPPSGSGLNITPLPPLYAIVEVSTVRDGLMLGYTNRQGNATQPTDVQKGFLKRPMDRGGGPYRTFSGLSLLAFAANRAREVNEPNGMALFAVNDINDGDFISLKQWTKQEDNEDKYKGRGIGCAWIAMGTSFRLRAEHLPYALKEIVERGGVKGIPVFREEQPTEVFVRITPVKFALGADLSTLGVSTIIPAVASISTDRTFGVVDADSQLRFREDAPYDLECKNRFEPLDYGQTSQPCKVYLPSAGVGDILEMIRASVLIWILVRPDVDKDNGDPTGLGIFSDEIRRFLCPTIGFDNYYSGGFLGIGDDSQIFRTDILNAADRIAESFMKRMMVAKCDPALDRMKQLHYDNTAGLLGESLVLPSGFNMDDRDGNTTWKERNIIEMIIGRKWVDDTAGVHMNCNTVVGLESRKTQVDWLNKLAKGMEVRMYEKMQNQTGVVYALDLWDLETDDVHFRLPVWFVNKNRNLTRARTVISSKLRRGLEGKTLNAIEPEFWDIVPCRNSFTPEVMASVRAVLGATLKHETPGEWISFRPLDTLLEPIDDFLEDVLDYMKAIRKGLAAIVEKILKFIKMIETRIMEVQALIRRIQRIVAKLKDFSIEADLKYLLVSSAGTSGLSADFMAAEEKPEDGSESYGMGGVIVMGGIPFLLLDLIGAIISPGDDETTVISE